MSPESDNTIDSFVRAWLAKECAESDQTPDLELFLNENGLEGHGEVILKLIGIDLEYRWKLFREHDMSDQSGDAGIPGRPQLADYRKFLPENASFPGDDLINKVFTWRHRYGDRPTVEDYAAEHQIQSETVLNDLRKIAHDETGRQSPAPCSTDSDLEETHAMASSDEPQKVPIIGPAGSRFEILDEPVTGGLGRVYRAHDKELDREVALKDIRPDRIADQRVVQRFIHEAMVTGKLEHPGIVPVYSFTQDSPEAPFYVMRYVKGTTLAQSIADYWQRQSSGMSLDESRTEFLALLRRVIDVCDAIGFAHSKGIIHRDLKPQNIMIGRYGETIVIDWGLATSGSSPTEEQHDPGPEQTQQSSLETATVLDERLTQDGDSIGTIAYMSPEQASGRSSEVTAASDIYGIGAILYEVITGRPAISPGKVDGAGHEDRNSLLHRVTTGNFPPAGSVNPNISPALAAVCAKAMRTDPANRYASTKELSNDLEAWIDDRPVTAWPEPVTVRFRRSLRKHITLVATSLAALLVGLTSLALFSSQLSRTNKELALLLERQQFMTSVATTQSAVAALENEHFREARERFDSVPEEHRGFAHKLLDAELRKHSNPLPSSARIMGQANSAVILSGTFPYVWNPGIGTWKRVSGDKLSPDGIHIASVGRVVTVENISDGTSTDFEGHYGNKSSWLGATATGATSVAFSADSTLLVTGGDDESVNVWSLETEQQVAVFERPYPIPFNEKASPIRMLSVSSDNKHVIAYGSFRSKPNGSRFTPVTFRVWSIETGELVSEVAEPISPSDKNALMASFKHAGFWKWKDNTTVFCAATDQLLDRKHYDSKSWNLSRTPDGDVIVEEPAVGHVVSLSDSKSMSGKVFRFSSDCSHVICGTADGDLVTWNADNGELANRSHVTDGQIRDIVCGPNANWAVYSFDTELNESSVSVHYFSPHITTYESPVNGVAFDHDGDTMVTVSESDGAKVWDMDSGALVAALDHVDVVDASFASDRAGLITCSNTSIRIWSSETFAENTKRRIDLDGSDSASITVSPDGRLVAMGDYKGLSLYDVIAGAKIFDLPSASPARVRGYFVEDGDMLIVYGAVDEGAQLVDLTGYSALTPGDWQDRVLPTPHYSWRPGLSGNSETVPSARFSCGGRVFTRIQADTARRPGIHDVGYAAFDAPEGSSSASLSPDGREVFTIGDRLRVWDCPTGLLTCEMRSIAGNCIAFIPSGEVIVVGHRNGVALFDLNRELFGW